MTQLNQPATRAKWLIALSVFTLAALGYLLSAYVPPDIENSRVDVHGDRVRYWLLVGHIGFGAVATAAGLAQFWPALRRRRPALHRWTGRAYFFAGIFPSSILLIPVAAMSESGLSNMAGLYAQTVLWVWTGVAGLRAARARRYADHREWMIRNYAVTLAALTSRLWGGAMALIVFAQADSRTYQGNTVAMIHDIASSGLWLSLLFNLIAVEVHLQRRKSGAGEPAPAGSGRRRRPSRASSPV
ncbi:DUF2306 domain-containing protein [Amycolatopsis anabasis]|uniref:DUF2306 domain-containing protein n=1 Tax=Amycolatopsis anabasis TaxID=1840409 RepID=UPI00131DB45B|nr:DUF2306 domain-containing protein [Amycolatopsis anabasis]